MDNMSTDLRIPTLPLCPNVYPSMGPQLTANGVKMLSLVVSTYIIISLTVMVIGKVIYIPKNYIWFQDHAGAGLFRALCLVVIVTTFNFCCRPLVLC